MTAFDRLENRFGSLAFPGLLRYYALFHVLVYILQVIRPEVAEVFAFDREKIFSGEVWRVVTMFFAGSMFGKFTPLTLVFLYFAVNFVFMVNDGLENAWGSFKTSLFCYAGILAILVGNFIYPAGVPGSGMAMYGAAFLAFATLFPKVEVRLFFVIPVQMRFLGMLAGGLLLLTAFSQPIFLPFYLAAYANYLVWAAIPALRGTARVLEAGQRRKAFNAKKLDATEAFHTCVICRRNDVDDSEVEFRIGKDGREYCEEHLPE